MGLHIVGEICDGLRYYSLGELAVTKAMPKILEDCYNCFLIKDVFL